MLSKIGCAISSICGYCGLLTHFLSPQREQFSKKWHPLPGVGSSCSNAESHEICNGLLHAGCPTAFEKHFPLLAPSLASVHVKYLRQPPLPAITPVQRQIPQIGVNRITKDLQCPICSAQAAHTTHSCSLRLCFYGFKPSSGSLCAAAGVCRLMSCHEYASQCSLVDVNNTTQNDCMNLDVLCPVVPRKCRYVHGLIPQRPVPQSSILFAAIRRTMVSARYTQTMTRKPKAKAARTDQGR